MPQVVNSSRRSEGVHSAASCASQSLPLRDLGVDPKDPSRPARIKHTLAMRPARGPRIFVAHTGPDKRPIRRRTSLPFPILGVYSIQESSKNALPFCECSTMPHCVNAKTSQRILNYRTQLCECRAPQGYICETVSMGVFGLRDDRSYN